MAAAEASLRQNEIQVAESHFRQALAEGWQVVGALEMAEGRVADARDAYLRASTSAVDSGAALYWLALVHLQAGEAAKSVAILSRLSRANPRDVPTRRLFAQALIADGHPEEAVQELEEARATHPDDPELTFNLASGYLRLKKLEAAERLFNELVRAKPLAATYVLIGRTYRDAGYLDQARVALQTALKKDPRVRRAHYYLGTLSGVAEGGTQLDDAIAEFQQELKLAPGDSLTNLRLGMALVEAQRPAEALPPLQAAIRSQAASPVAHFFLGRCQLALGKPAEAVTSLRKALELVQAPPVDETRAGLVHYQLGRALRELGNEQEAAQHFVEAERFSGRRTEQSREQLTRYLQDAPDPDIPAALDLVRSPLAELPAAARADLNQRTRTAITRAYFNLGVIHTQADRFERAAEFFESAAQLNPDFPQVQYSLGVALFNAKRYDKAAEPLTRALAATPDDANIRRMLALSWLNAEVYDKAADLLRDDPQRAADPALQYAYGLALVRSDRAAEAEAIFSGLLSAHGENAELNVVLAQAHAQQGDFDAAIESVKRALQAKPDVAEANTTLGIIYQRQGKLKEAAEVLEAELKSHPRDIRARHTLAMVHDMEGRQDEALVAAAIGRCARSPITRMRDTCLERSCWLRATHRTPSTSSKRPSGSRRKTPTSTISLRRPIRNWVVRSSLRSTSSSIGS